MGPHGPVSDAKELIGVMHAMSLGVERDDERAFEWFPRSSMKGHPGAQSGIGWRFEISRAEVLINDYRPWKYPLR